MKNRLFARSIDEQRDAIRERLDRCRLKHNPECHMLVADDDYDAMLLESIQAYEIKHSIKLVPMRDIVEHKAGGHCRSCLPDSNAA